MVPVAGPAQLLQLNKPQIQNLNTEGTSAERVVNASISRLTVRMELSSAETSIAAIYDFSSVLSAIKIARDKSLRFNI